MAAVPSRGRASLVEGAAGVSDAAAIEDLYTRHSAKILGYCVHQLGSREEAEDAVQTTFMNAFRALGRGVVPESESAWLFKIAENVCLSRRRSSWRRNRIESPSDFDVIEEIVPGPSRQRDELIGIEDALANMPEQQRRAILLREWQGLSYREIAQELEVSQSAVETLIFRARRSLAQGLEQPEAQRKPKQGLRRALRVADAGSILAAAKALFAGSAAVKATAAAVAVTAVAGTAASVKNEGHSPIPADAAAAPALVVKAPAPQARRGAATPVSAAAAVAAERDTSSNAPRARPAIVTPGRKALKENAAKKTAVRGSPAAPAAAASGETAAEKPAKLKPARDRSVPVKRAVLPAHWGPQDRVAPTERRQERKPARVEPKPKQQRPEEQRAVRREVEPKAPSALVALAPKRTPDTAPVEPTEAPVATAADEQPAAEPAAADELQGGRSRGRQG